MKFLSKKQVKALVTLSFTQLGRLEEQGKFPKRLRLGEGRYSRVAYIETEVTEWMKQQLAKRNATLP